jgi:hypothetical protein
VLLARVGARPLLEEIDLSLNTGNLPVSAIVDRDHFSDLLIYVLEELVGTGSQRISLVVEKTGGEAVVTIAGDTPHYVVPQKQKTWRFLEHLCERAGGKLSSLEEENLCRFVITLALA